MNDLLRLNDEELIDAAEFTDEEFDMLENRLAILAACNGWTGDPMRQPLATVAAIVRGIIGDRSV
jgi:hypothetical protein